MDKNIKLSIACMNLARAIKNGNKILSNSDYEKKWNEYRLYSQKIKNLKRKA